MQNIASQIFKTITSFECLTTLDKLVGLWLRLTISKMVWVPEEWYLLVPYFLIAQLEA